MPDGRLNAIVDAIVDRTPTAWTPPRGGSAEPSVLRALRAIQAIAGAAPRTVRPIVSEERPAVAKAIAIVRRTSFWIVLGYITLAAFGLASGHVGRLSVPVAATLVAVFGFGLCAVWLLVGGARDPRAGALGAFYLVVAATFAGRFVPQSWALGALAWAVTPPSFLPLFLWTFVSDFPRTQRASRLDAVCRWGLRLSAIVGVSLLAGNALVAAQVSWAPAVLGRSSYVFGNLYWSAIFGLMFPAFAVIAGKRRLATPSEGRRAVVFAFGFVLVLLFVAIEILAEIFIPSFAAFMKTHRAEVSPLFFGVILLQPAITTYAVLVDRVFDVKTALNRGARYLLARHVLVGLDAVPLALLIVFLYAHRSQTIGQALSERMGLALLSFSVAGVVLTLLRNRALRYVDEHFERTPVDWAGETATLTAAIGNARTAPEAIEVVELTLARCLGVRAVHTYRMNASRTSFDAVDASSRPITDSDALFVVISSDRVPVMLDGSPDDLRPLLPPGDREWCEHTATAMLVPIFGSADSPLGAIAVSAKHNGDQFLRGERTFVRTIAGTVALKLEGVELTADAHGRNADDEAAMVCDACGRASIVRGPCVCGGRLRPASVPVLLAGKFTTTAYVGAGAMGIVYRATDTTLNRTVALKTLGRLSGAAADRLASEARIMAAVAHPNLATIYGVERWRRTPILVLEYLERGSLASRLHQPMPINEVLRLGVLLAPALEQLHQAHILHRDIKPTNIGFTRDEAPKLLDFGLASFLTASDTSSGIGSAASGGDASRTQALRIGALTLAGTPLYLPPEAQDGAAPSPAFDVWALALVLFEAIAGRHPFAADSVSGVFDKVRRSGPPDLSRFRPDCPAGVVTAFRQWLAPEPADRCASAAALRASLEDLLAGNRSTE